MEESVVTDWQIIAVLICGALILVPPLFAGVDRDLVGYYPFEGNPQDQSGKANHGSEYGGVSYGAGKVGEAAQFDGIDDYIRLPRVVEEDFTVVFWVRTSAVAPNGTEWWQGFGLVDAEVCGSPGGGDWGIAQLNGGRVFMGGGIETVQSNSHINDGNWNPVAATWDTTVGQIAVYVHGVLEDDIAIGWIGPLTGPPWIGVANNPCDVQFNRLWFPGEIDELRFYERILRPFEIHALSQDFIFFDDYESGDNTAWASSMP